MPKVEVNKVATLEGHNDCIYALSPSLNDTSIISGAGDGMVVEWDIHRPKDGRLIVQVPNSVYALHLIPNTSKLIIGQNFEGIHEIDLVTNKELRSLKLTNVELFDIQSYDDRIVVGNKLGELIIVNKTSFAIENVIRESEKSARSIAIGKNDIAVGYSDNCIRIFDKQTLLLKQTIQAHDISVFSLKYSPDGKCLMSGARDAHIKFWEVGSYKLLQAIPAHMYAINHVAYTEKGDYFFSCSMDKSIKVWDGKTKELLKVIDKVKYAGHGTSINKLLWSSKTQQLISASDDRTLTVWDIKFN